MKNQQFKLGIKVCLRLSFCLLIVFQSFSALAQPGPGIAKVKPPKGGFDIDGNLQANTPTAGKGDWIDGVAGTGERVLIDATGAPIDSTVTFHLVDLYNSGTDDNFGGGLKFNDNPNSWSWLQNPVGGKVDINHALFHLAIDSVTGHQWIIVAADRASNSGDAYIDFEFLQNTLTKNPNGTFTSAGTNGGRTANDFALTLSLTNGGSTAGFNVFRWQSVSGGYNYVDRTATVPSGAVYAAVNKVVVPVPFGAFGATTYPANLFVEAGIDLTALLGSFDACSELGIKTIFIKTKVSASASATVVDFVTPKQVSLVIGVANAGTDQVKCSAGATTDFSLVGSATPSPGQTVSSVTWTQVSGNVSFSNPNSLSTTATVTGSSASARLTVNTTNGTSTCSVSDVVVLTVGTGPSASVNSPIVCGTTSSKLTVSTNAASPAYLWNTGATTSEITVSPASTTTYTVTITNTGTNCSSTATGTVTVNSLPSVEVNSPVKCADDPAVTITATPSPAGSYIYSWSVPFGATDPGNVSSFSASVGGGYNVVITNSSNCSSSNSGLLTVNLNPTIVISLNPDTINTVFTTSSQIDIQSISPGVIADYSYSWEIITKPSGANASLNNALTSSPTLQIQSPHVLGTYTIQVTAVDLATGCSNTSTRDVEVVERSKPVCDVNGDNSVCPGSSNDYEGPSPIPSGFTYSWTLTNNTNNASISGNANGTSVTVNAGTKCASSYTVHLHIQSSNGLVTSDCEEVVTVDDEESPELSIPGDVELTCGSSTDVSNTGGEASATDGCSGLKSITHSDSPIEANCTGIAGIERTWKAEDNCGNISESIQHITFKDETAPEITCPSNVQVQCGGSVDTAITGKATATDNCSGKVTITYSDEAADANCTGQNGIARTWRAEDACGNFKTCVQYITYVDNIAPVITACAADVTIECDGSSDPHDTGFPTATDNCGDVTLTWKDNSNISGCVGTITRTWTAEDGCGNKTTCVQHITIHDRTAPTLNAPVDIQLSCTDSTNPSVTGTATTGDNCSGVTVYYRDAAVAGSSCVGKSNIDRTWTAIDGSGNITSKVQHITF